VIICNTSAIAIIAEDVRFLLPIFLGHWLFINVTIESSELTFHVGNALGAYWTFVACVAPLCEAGFVYAMSTSHERDWFAGSEHVLSTYRAVTFGTLLDTFVSRLCLNGHASRTGLAVEEILAESLTESTYSAIVTMIDTFSWIVIPQFAYRTVVAGSLLITHLAHLGDSLGSIA
jgi:hypothetical protein